MKCAPPLDLQCHSLRPQSAVKVAQLWFHRPRKPGLFNTFFSPFLPSPEALRFVVASPFKLASPFLRRNGVAVLATQAPACVAVLAMHSFFEICLLPTHLWGGGKKESLQRTCSRLWKRVGSSFIMLITSKKTHTGYAKPAV